jgi:hypothetical protein
VTGNPRLYVAPPSFTPAPYGLLSVAQARYDETNPHWRAGVTWQSLCGIADSTYDSCLAVTGTGDPPDPPSKAATATWQARGATPFTVYAEFDCSPAVFAAQSQRLGEESLTRTESWQVEQAFWTGLAGGQTVVFPHLAADAQVLDTEGVLLQTASTAVTGVVDIVEGLGTIEKALADCLNGVGVIHVPAELIPTMSALSLLVEDRGRLRTWNGNWVAAGAGYPGTAPDGTAPAAGTSWIYGTGPVFAYRSAVEVMPLSSIVNRSNNDVQAIAERTYVLGFDCCHVAALISTGGESAGTAGAAT